MHDKEWDFFDKFTVREAAVAAVNCSFEVVEILPDDWFCEEEFNNSKLYKGTARKIRSFESQFIRAARAYIEQDIVGEFEFFKHDDFTNSDFGYRNQVYISRESLRSWFEMRAEVPKAFQNVQKPDAFDSNNVCSSDKVKELEAKIKLLEEKKTLGLSSVTVSNTIAALTDLIINPQSHSSSKKIVNQAQLLIYIENNFKGKGLKSRTLNELYSRINKLSEIRIDNQE